MAAEKDVVVTILPEVTSIVWMRLCSVLMQATIRRFGVETAALVERTSMRRHQSKHFLEGMEKLGLPASDNEVRRVATYHYLSNVLGGLPLEYVEERPDKIWLRYRAPYWMGDGMSMPSSGPAGLGSELGIAPFQGWHANNGAVLDNPHLVFVQTQNLLDGDPWDAGYYTEAEQTFPDGEAYVRAKAGEWGPPMVVADAPTPATGAWPAERRLGALRNYAVSTTTSRIVTISQILGEVAAGELAEEAFRVVLTQFASELPEQLGLATVDSPYSAARYVSAFLSLAGDEAEVATVAGGAQLIVGRSRMWRFEADPLAEVDRAVARAWEMTLPLHQPGLRCAVELDGSHQTWTFTHEEAAR